MPRRTSHRQKFAVKFTTTVNFRLPYFFVMTNRESQLHPSEAIADSFSASLLDNGPKLVSLATLLRPDLGSRFGRETQELNRRRRHWPSIWPFFLRDFSGPWIQHSIDAKEIMLMYAVYGRPPEGISSKFEDFDQVCISCRFEHNWASTNKAWKDFPQGLQLRQHPPGFDDFFLSFAQILVDIDDELQQTLEDILCLHCRCVHRCLSRPKRCGKTRPWTPMGKQSSFVPNFRCSFIARDAKK